jgi:hypothetical protein
MLFLNSLNSKIQKDNEDLFPFISTMYHNRTTDFGRVKSKWLGFS